jgi:hypothetical protein
MMPIAAIPTTFPLPDLAGSFGTVASLAGTLVLVTLAVLVFRLAAERMNAPAPAAASWQPAAAVASWEPEPTPRPAHTSRRPRVAIGPVAGARRSAA